MYIEKARRYAGEEEIPAGKSRVSPKPMWKRANVEKGPSVPRAEYLNLFLPTSVKYIIQCLFTARWAILFQGILIFIEKIVNNIISYEKSISMAYYNSLFRNTCILRRYTWK